MSSNLSEKAKGKQRAVEALDNAPATPPSKNLTIRFTEGVPDLTLQVAEKDTVKEVKAKVDGGLWVRRCTVTVAKRDEEGTRIRGGGGV